MKLSNRSLSRLQDVETVLIAIVVEGIIDSPYDFGIPRYGGKRTVKEQIEMYAQGRTKKGRIVTWTLKSYHKTGRAFDIFAYVDGRASWDMEHLEPIARHLQKIAKDRYNINLEWGFDLWGKDGAHFQIKDT